MNANFYCNQLQVYRSITSNLYYLLHHSTLKALFLVYFCFVLVPNCRDISAMPGLCPLMRSQCKTNRMIRGFCLKTCQVCTSCPVIEEEDERRNDVGTIGTSTGQPAGCDIDGKYE